MTRTVDGPYTIRLDLDDLPAYRVTFSVDTPDHRLAILKPGHIVLTRAERDGEDALPTLSNEAQDTLRAWCLSWWLEKEAHNVRP